MDKIVTDGEAYGFTIGDSKQDTYKKAQIIFKDKKIFILYPLERGNFGPHKKISMTDSEFLMINTHENWDFYFDEGFFDFIKLTFKDDKLVKIYRHRKRSELP